MPAGEPDLVGLGRFARERRTELGLTQHQLAERLGWSQERVSVLENGKYGMPSVPLLSRLSEALEVPLADILDAAGFSVARETAGAPPDEAERIVALFFALERLLAIEGGDIHATASAVGSMLAAVMGADKIDIFVYDPKDEALVALGTSDTPMGHLQVELGLNRLPIAGGGRTVEVFETGRTYTTGHADQDPGVLAGLKDQLGIRSLVNVPLDVNGTRRGVFSIASDQPDRFSVADRRFAEMATRWVSLILHRAELARKLDSAEK
jgi:transcriptional regulator with XRE-family HTH domain